MQKGILQQFVVLCEIGNLIFLLFWRKIGQTCEINQMYIIPVKIYLCDKFKKIFNVIIKKKFWIFEICKSCWWIVCEENYKNCFLNFLKNFLSLQMINLKTVWSFFKKNCNKIINLFYDLGFIKINMSLKKQSQHGKKIMTEIDRGMLFIGCLMNFCWK